MQDEQKEGIFVCPKCEAVNYVDKSLSPDGWKCWNCGAITIFDPDRLDIVEGDKK